MKHVKSYIGTLGISLCWRLALSRMRLIQAAPVRRFREGRREGVRDY